MRRSATVHCAAAVGAAALALAACAAKRPVLYPNAAYQQAGEARAREDVDECVELANAHGHDTDVAARAGSQAAEGATVGAATGAAVGAVLGNAARGTAAGAAGGGARWLVHSLFGWRDPDPIHQASVQECLAERGYRVIGWE